MVDPKAPLQRLILGIQPVREAVRAHRAALSKVILQRGKHSRTLDGLERFARDQGIPVEHLPQRELDKLARGARHQGAGAYAPPLELGDWTSMSLNATLAAVALDGITDPQNFGAAIRSAVALGSGDVIWAEHNSAPLSPTTFRASAGAIEHASLCRVASLRRTIGELAERGVATVVLDAAGQEPLSAIDLCRPVVLVVGAEGGGVSRGVRRSCAQQAKLPMRGSLDSLNTSVAVAVALYEVSRQRSTSE